MPKLAKKIRMLLLVALLLGGILPVGGWMVQAKVAAQDASSTICKVDPKTGNVINPDPKKPCVTPAPQPTSDEALQKKCNGTDCGLIQKYINPLIKFLAGLIGIVVAASIIWGGIQYASSADDPQKVSQAKSRIFNSLGALVAFIFLFAFLSWLTPGTGGSATSCAPQSFFGLPSWTEYVYKAGHYKLNSISHSCEFTEFSYGDLLLVALALLDMLLRVAGLVAVAYVIWGGIQYVTSQGEPDKTKRALGTIKNALIGLLVAIVAIGFVSFVGQRVG